VKANIIRVRLPIYIKNNNNNNKLFIKLFLYNLQAFFFFLKNLQDYFKFIKSLLKNKKAIHIKFIILKTKKKNQKIAQNGKRVSLVVRTNERIARSTNFALHIVLMWVHNKGNICSYRTVYTPKYEDK
jgi:hypothetical protein